MDSAENGGEYVSTLQNIWELWLVEKKTVTVCFFGDFLVFSSPKKLRVQKSFWLSWNFQLGSSKLRFYLDKEVALISLCSLYGDCTLETQTILSQAESHLDWNLI